VTIGVITGGLILLITLATCIGLALDQQARGAAWRRIASARRRNGELARELDERELSLRVREHRVQFREVALGLTAPRPGHHSPPPDIAV
jgi:hypothetical protein